MKKENKECKISVLMKPSVNNRLRKAANLKNSKTSACWSLNSEINARLDLSLLYEEKTGVKLNEVYQEILDKEKAEHAEWKRRESLKSLADTLGVSVDIAINTNAVDRPIKSV